MDCVNCGAPLPAKSNVCQFCQTLNDADLRALQRQAVKGPASGRNCPHCDVKLESIDLKIKGGFIIERCDRCLGMFFDPNELEAVLSETVEPVHDVDFQRMQQIINEESTSDTQDFKYIKCPVCSKVMNRKAYGARSGVIVDTCRDHGVWLDGGELAQLIKWSKAGGRVLDARREKERQQAEQRKRRINKELDQREAMRRTMGRHVSLSSAGIEDCLLVGAVRLITRLVR